MFGPYLAGVLDMEFARGLHEPGNREDAGHEMPRHLLAAFGDFLLEEFVQPEHSPDVECQEDVAEVARVFSADAFDLHLDGLRDGFVRVIPFGLDVDQAQLLCFAGGLPVEEGAKLGPASSLAFGEFPEVGDRAKPGPLRGPHGLHELPVYVVLAALPSRAPLEEHRAPRPPPVAGILA